MIDVLFVICSRSLFSISPCTFTFVSGHEVVFIDRGCAWFLSRFALGGIHRMIEIVGSYTNSLALIFEAAFLYFYSNFYIHHYQVR